MKKCCETCKHQGDKTWEGPCWTCTYADSFHEVETYPMWEAKETETEE